MDMLLEQCLSDVGQWLDDTLSDLTHIRDELRNGAEPASIERRRPKALAPLSPRLKGHLNRCRRRMSRQTQPSRHRRTKALAKHGG